MQNSKKTNFSSYHGEWRNYLEVAANPSFLVSSTGYNRALLTRICSSNVQK